MILGLEKRMPVEYQECCGRMCNSFCFGGWDNDPHETVHKAMKEAGIEGCMRHGSGYRKTNIELYRGKIYRWHIGDKTLMKELDIQ